MVVVTLALHELPVARSRNALVTDILYDRIMYRSTQITIDNH